MSLETLFSRGGRHLPLVLGAQLAFLAALILLAFFLPLSETERWAVVLCAGTLAGLTWALVDHGRRG